jgi:hypothetical protein
VSPILFISFISIKLSPHIIRKYLSDPMDDVKVATENLLADFLREVREVAYLQKRREEKVKAQRYAKQEQREHRDTDPPKEALPEITMVVPDRAAFIPDNDGQSSLHDGESFREKEPAAEDDRDTGGELPCPKLPVVALNDSASFSLDSWPGCLCRPCGYCRNSYPTTGFLS